MDSKSFSFCAIGVTSISNATVSNVISNKKQGC